MYKLIISTDDEYESGFVRNQGKGDIHLKSDHAAAEGRHMDMVVKMSDLFGFVNDLEEIIYGLGFKLILKRNINDRAVNAGADARANDGNIDIRDISWCVSSIDPSNDNRIILQKRLKKRIILILVIMKEIRFIRMYSMLITSYLILARKVVWEDHKI